mgnify:CR=1 FL=1|jgi:hypothetical protein
MNNFLSIYQYINENYAGSSKDIFKMAIEAYEDEYGEVSDQTANKWYEETA